MNPTKKRSALLYNLCHKQSKGNPIFFVLSSGIDADTHIHCLITKRHRCYVMIWHKETPLTHLIRCWTPQQLYKRIFQYHWMIRWIAILHEPVLPLAYYPTCTPQQIHDTMFSSDETSIFRIYTSRDVESDAKQQMASTNIVQFFCSLPRKQHHARLTQVHSSLLIHPPSLSGRFMGGVSYWEAMRDFESSVNEMKLL